MKNITLIVFSIVFTLLGLAGGYLTAAKKESAPAEAKEPAGEPHAAGPKLSAQALKNLGVTLAPAETKAFIKHRDIPAVVVDLPLATRALLAPVGGRIVKIAVKPGTVVETGAVLIQLLRDPLPRPIFTLTEEVLKFTNEDLHRTAADLRKAASNAQLLKTELKRLEQISGPDGNAGAVLMPRKNIIDLRYEGARAELELNNARLELRQHGLTPERITQLESGQPLTATGQLAWKQSFERNGLWPAPAEALFQALPLAVRELPWNVAAIGELAATGLIDDELIAWIKSTPESTTHFQNIAALLQQGRSLPDLKTLWAETAFAPLVEIKAPVFASGEKGDWDVGEITARAGEKVEAGGPLLILINSRQMLLKALPAGSDAELIQAAFAHDDPLEAEPLIAGSAPALKALKISRIDGDDASHGMSALVLAQNEPLRIREEGALGKVRTWNLRKGMKYVLRVPVKKIDDVFLVPSDAVTDDGPDKIIFIQDGDSFKALKVELLHIDHEVAVIANNKDTELFPGDSVVQHGAFGLSLALKAGSAPAEGGEEAHAGHHHHHH